MRLPFVVALHGLYGSAVGTVAAVVLPYLDDSTRAEIFAVDGLSPLERAYSEEFKQATASGERSRGAHVRALEAVHRKGGSSIRRGPARLAVARWLSWASNAARGSHE